MFPRPSLPAGFELSPRPSLPTGRDFGPVRTCGAFPPTAARQAPHRSRSHGRLRRPKSLPIRHSPAAAQCFSPWAAGIASVLTSWLHRFASLGLKSGIAAGIAPVLASLLHRFASLGLKSRIAARFLPRMAPRLQRFASLGLKSRIDARIAPDLTSWLQRLPSLSLKSGIAAAPSLRQRRIARLQQSRGVQAGTGCHEGGIILSKKPPEWRPVPAASTACIRF